MKRVCAKCRCLGTACLLVLVLSGCKGESEDHENDHGSANGGSGGTGVPTGGTSGTAGGPPADFDCEGYCSDLGACRSVSMQGCLFTCGTWESNNGALGCGTEFQAALDCFRATALCTFTEGACNAEMTSYAACASRSASTACAALCETIGQCDGVAPADCLNMCAKDARQIADLGCSRQHDAYLTCVMSQPNLCDASPADCGAEDLAVLRCGTR